MTRTVLESKSKTVVIGFDEPFCVIGERINPTGRKKLAAELEAGDFSTVERDALEQVACGAMVLDVNAGVVYNSNPNPNETEPPLMRRMIELVQGLVDVPLCIDSSVPGALEAGLAAAEGRPLLNSVTGEEDRLDLVLPLVKKYNVPVVAISNDDTGISEDPDVRFAVANKIVDRAAAREEIQRAGGGHLQRRHRNFRGPRRSLCRGQEDRGARRRFRDTRA